MKFLSIIIPHYNLPKELLMRCIDSIIAQEMPDDSYEIIVVDDGSIDPPLWAQKKYDNVLRVIANEHTGPGGTRNKGIEVAEGKYIQFVDADDCIPDNTLCACLDIIRSERPKIFRFQYRICKSESEITKEANKHAIRYSNTTSGASFMADNNLCGAPWTYIFEREVAIKHNIRFETNVYHEDEEFNTKLHYHATSIIESNIIAYNYCIRKESITSNTDKQFEEKRINDLFSLLKRLITFKDSVYSISNPLQQKGLDRKLATLTVDTIINLFFAGKSAKEVHNLCKTELKEFALYPLPKRSFSVKYRIFRKLANNIFGIYILRFILPAHKPDKR
ncbi:MAG: glycosyltransferase family 2 protein [Bacteroidaceae bacterium]|nr:glycosyltransferase family 2 protein [Bacteroidaceae bacterium]